MKKKLGSLICLCLFFAGVFPATAQNHSWSKGFGNSWDDMAQGIAADTAGNVYTTGFFEGTVDFNPGVLVYNLTATNADIFISKLDAAGNFQWAKRIGNYDFDEAFAITLDQQSNIYVTGYFNSSVDFDPGPGSVILSSSAGGNGTPFILKLNSAGDFIWAKKLDGSGYGYPSSISVDRLGNVFTTGYFNGTLDFDPDVASYNQTGANDIYISKLDTYGDFVWARIFGSSSDDRGFSVVTDSSGNSFTTGYFRNSVDFDPGTGSSIVTPLAGMDIFLLKLDADGNFGWVKQIGSYGDDAAHGLVIDNSGNLILTGYFSASTDFDPGQGVHNLSCQGIKDVFVVRLDKNGDFRWAKSFGGTSQDWGNSVTVDASGNIYSTGWCFGNVDFDPGADVQSFNCGGSYYLSVLDTSGNYIGATIAYGPGQSAGTSIAVSEKGNIYSTGYFENSQIFGTTALSALNSQGSWDFFIVSHSLKGIFGNFFIDYNQNCVQNQTEIGLKQRRGIVQPGNLLVESTNFGQWQIDSLPAGQYSITIDTTGHWSAPCGPSAFFNVTNSSGLTSVSGIGLLSNVNCPQPDISVSAPVLRRCFSNQQIYIQACNSTYGTGALMNSHAEVKLDTFLTINSASITFSSIGNNTYRFPLGTLNPGECENFSISTTLSCSAALSQTICMEALLFPADSCVFDTIPAGPSPVGPGTTSPCTLPWDRSSLSVNGSCQNDSVVFTITNTGSPVNGNMLCYAPVRVFIDGVLTYTDSILLGGGQTITYSYPGNGQTWILQADQHSLHPGNSHPNAHVEACGDSTYWTPGLINILPLDDADPVKDIYCGVVSGSYDPNDKTGYPLGLGSLHEILPNQQIEYLVRFQNTGTDTAFTVVVRDTLDADMNIFSVVAGAASHAYTFRMYGPRVLEWTFSSILLPDSTTDEVNSHGFLTFTLEQNPDLPSGTTILNHADIYFDFNDPVITNITMHTINRYLNNFPVGLSDQNKFESFLKVYPNPSENVFHILNENTGNTLTTFEVRNTMGQVVNKVISSEKLTQINLSDWPVGIYFITATSLKNIQTIKVVKQ